MVKLTENEKNILMAGKELIRLLEVGDYCIGDSEMRSTLEINGSQIKKMFALLVFFQCGCKFQAFVESTQPQDSFLSEIERWNRDIRYIKKVIEFS